MSSAMDTRGEDVTTGSEQGLPRAALRYENLRTVVTAVPVMAALLAVALLLRVEWVTVVALGILLPLCVLGTLLDLVLINRLQYRAYRFAVDGGTVQIHRGILFRSRTTVSVVQILSVDVVQGPLLRGTGLSVVSFRTVGGAVALGPVTPGTAATVRATVLRAVGSPT